MVARGETMRGITGLRIGPQARLGVHRAFGLACGARGEDQQDWRLGKLLRQLQITG